MGAGAGKGVGVGTGAAVGAGVGVAAGRMFGAGFGVDVGADVAGIEAGACVPAGDGVAEVHAKSTRHPTAMTEILALVPSLIPPSMYHP